MRLFIAVLVAVALASVARSETLDCAADGSCSEPTGSLSGHDAEVPDTEKLFLQLESLFGSSKELSILREMMQGVPAADFPTAVDTMFTQLGDEYFATLRGPGELTLASASFEELEAEYLARKRDRKAQAKGGKRKGKGRTKKAGGDSGPPPDPHKEGVFDPVTKRFYPKTGAKAKHTKVKQVDIEEGSLTGGFDGADVEPDPSYNAGDQASILGDANTIDEFTLQYLSGRGGFDFEDEQQAAQDTMGPEEPAETELEPGSRAASKKRKRSSESDIGSAKPATSVKARRPAVRPPVEGPQPISYHKPGQAPSHSHFKVLSEWPGPRVYAVENFVSKEEIDHMLSVAQGNLHRFGPRGTTGIAMEFPAAEDPKMNEILQREYALMGFPNEGQGYFRLRRYEQGDYHPLHTDTYSFNDNTLIATLILYLTTPEEGGETVFPRAFENRFNLTEDELIAFPDMDLAKPVDPKTVLSVPAKAGTLVIWMSCTPSGEDDMLSLHAGRPLVKGIKWTATNFIYTSLSHCDFGPSSSPASAGAGAAAEAK